MHNSRSFYFLRHGQTDWNKDRLCQGQFDIPLNATGFSQAHDAKALLASHPIATICSSPLGRARRTADIINEALDCPVVTIDGLRECSFGELEGRPVGDHNFFDLLTEAQNWGGESEDSFVERISDAVKEALSYPGPVLLVSHGGAYWALRQRFGIDIDHDIANAAPVHVRPPENGGDQWWVETIEPEGGL